MHLLCQGTLSWEVLVDGLFSVSIYIYTQFIYIYAFMMWKPDELMLHQNLRKWAGFAGEWHHDFGPEMCDAS